MIDKSDMCFTPYLITLKPQPKKPEHDPSLFYKLLNDLGFPVNYETQKIMITKDSGTFEINLKNGNVWFTATECSECDIPCEKIRKICIVLADTTYSGWSNAQLKKSEMLILSKILALRTDTLPSTIQKQFNTCPPDILRRALHQELRAHFQAKSTPQSE